MRLSSGSAGLLLAIGSLLAVSVLSRPAHHHRVTSPPSSIPLPGPAPLWKWSSVVSPGQLDDLLDEVMSVDRHPLRLTLSNSGRRLAFIRGTEAGRAAFILNLTSRETLRLPLAGDAANIYGWSPDDAWLTLSESPKERLHEEHLILYDTHAGTMIRLTSTTGLLERGFVWLGDERYFFATRRAANADILYRTVGDWRLRTSHRARSTLDEFVPISNSKAAFGYDGNIHESDIDPPGSPAIVAVTHFSNGFDAFLGRWLRYNVRTRSFLFSSTPRDANLRYLYKSVPDRGELVRLDDEDTYNGQWLEDGEGYAYVGNTDNHFHLSVRSKQPSSSATLFAEGSVAGFKVSPRGDRIYVSGAMGIEPQGIWEYDVRTAKLQEVLPGSAGQYVMGHLSEPQEHKLVSRGGARVSFLVYPPVVGPRAATPWIANLTKHPLLISVPPRTDQAQRVWVTHSQLLANLGWYVVEVNYRGCDGYGKSYAAMAHDAEGAASDVLAVYHEVVQYPDVDPRDVSLGGRSGGAAIVSQILRQAPGLWRAVLLDHPGGVHLDQQDPHTFPPMLVITGDQDPSLPEVDALMSWGRTGGVKVDLVVQWASGHVNWNQSEARKAEKRWLQFLEE